jgi:hypothetical protein
MRYGRMCFGIDVAIIGGGDREDGRMELTPPQVAERVTQLAAHRARPGPIDVALTAVSAPGDAVLAGEYADAGVTWWLEHLHDGRGDHAALLARVRTGPPR